MLHKCDSSKGPFKCVLCNGKKAGSNIRAGLTNSTLSQKGTGNSDVEGQRSAIINPLKRLCHGSPGLKIIEVVLKGIGSI